MPSPISIPSKDKPNQESKHSSDFRAILRIRFLLIFLVRIVPTSVDWETHWAGTGDVYLGKDILFAVSYPLFSILVFYINISCVITECGKVGHKLPA